MECYDPKVGVWEEAPSMTTPRAGAGVATVRNHIWACGGVSDFRNGVANKLTEEVEVFDVTKKMWPLVPYFVFFMHSRLCLTTSLITFVVRWRPEKHLTMPRAFGDLINIKDKLYLVGGLEVQPNHGLRVVASIVCRCAKTGTWKHWINLKCRRCHAKAVYKG